jgi:transcriptional antiterminator RfaH
MPILPAEPSVYPEVLLAESPPAQLGSHEWRVLHTRPRQEKALARELLQREVPFYLPLVEQRRRISGRMMKARLPLFGGYVFVYADHDRYLETLSTRRVVKSLRVPDQDRLWADLRRLQGLIASGLPILPEERLTQGQLVEITSGPLTGFEGRVIRSASGRRFVVEVDFIARGASVQCEGMSLRPIQERG